MGGGGSSWIGVKQVLTNLATLHLKILVGSQNEWLGGGVISWIGIKQVLANLATLHLKILVGSQKWMMGEEGEGMMKGLNPGSNTDNFWLTWWLELPTLPDPAGDSLKINRFRHTNMTTSLIVESFYPNMLYVILQNLCDWWENLLDFPWFQDACPVHSPFRFVHLTYQNLSAGVLFCLNSLAKVNTQLLIYNEALNMFDSVLCFLLAMLANSNK